jgi:hypothetical protein
MSIYLAVLAGLATLTLFGIGGSISRLATAVEAYVNRELKRDLELAKALEERDR